MTECLLFKFTYTRPLAAGTRFRTANSTSLLRHSSWGFNIVSFGKNVHARIETSRSQIFYNNHSRAEGY